MFRHHFLVDADFGRLWRAQAIVHSAAGRRAVLVSLPATKRSSVNLSLINNAKSASRIRRMLGNSRDVTAQLTALQQLAKLMQQQQGQAITTQAEYRQRLQLANKLLSQLAQKVNKMTAGSICRLCFILSRLQASEVNTTPLRQAAARQLVQQQQQNPTAAANDTSSHSGTAPAAALSSSATRTAAAAAAAAAGGLSSAADTAAAAAAAAAGWSANVTPGDLLYLLRALHTWQGDDRDHDDEISLVLLPAAVAAAAAYAQKFSLQELLMVVSILAKMHCYSLDLMNMAAARFAAAAAAAAHSSGSAAAATQTSDQQQQQQGQISDDLDSISDQIFVTYLWSNASLAHIDQWQQRQQRQQQQQLLPAAVRLLLSSDSSLVQCSQDRISNDSNAPTISDQKSCSMPRLAPRLLLLLQLNPKYLPMCAWSLAVMLISILARQTNQAASAAAAAGGGCSSTAAMQVSDSAVTAAAAATAATADLQQCEQLIPLVTAIVTLCELLAAAAAVHGSSSSSSDVIIRSGRLTSSQIIDQTILYDREGLVQLHHARILTTAAAAGCRQQQQLAYQQSSCAIYADNTSGSSSSSDLCERDNAQYSDLQQVVNAQIQQQQQITGADQVTSFRAACKQAWGSERPNTSHTQQQVYEELQRLGFSPHLELPALTAMDLLERSPNPQAITTTFGSCPASDAAHTYNTQSHTYNTQAVGSNHLIWALKQVIGTEDHDADGLLHGLHLDIACVVPHTLAEKMQHQGLITVLQQITNKGRSCTASAFLSSSSSSISHTGAGSSSSSSSSSSSDGGCKTSGTWPSGCGNSSGDLVVLAVEVDGPSHVAINDRSHLLGNTVCRNWVLQQLGYVVVTVSWWEWDAYCASSMMTLTEARQR